MLQHVVCASLIAVSLLLPSGAGAQNRQESAASLESDAQRILKQGQEAAAATQSANGLRSNEDPSQGPIVKRATKMVVAVVDRNGYLLAIKADPDAWVGSIDIASGKARTAAFFSSDENALTSRIVGKLSQPGQPLWGIWASNQAASPEDAKTRNTIITFPGGVPLYKDGKLVGAVGVSGDAVDQDEAVAFAAAKGFEPGEKVVKLGMTPPDVPTMDAQTTGTK